MSKRKRPAPKVLSQEIVVSKYDFVTVQLVDGVGRPIIELAYDRNNTADNPFARISSYNKEGQSTTGISFFDLVA